MEFTLSNIVIYVPNWIILISSSFFAFIITFTVVPSLVLVSNEKGLCDKPYGRKSHAHAIPTLGGAAVFIGMVLPTAIFGNQEFDHDLKYIMAGLLIMFFIGMKDDILVISAWKKIVSEIFAIGIIVILGDIRISNFHGFLGINDVPYIIGALFTMFVFIVIINGFNLIDGIDGLASGVGIITISTFGIWFILISEYEYAAFCFSAIGALIAFFRYNVFSIKNKIFLGDTGSLIIGLIVSIFAIQFLESNLVHTIGSINESAPAIAFGVLIVPMIDTLRVFAIRIFSGLSPFKGDRFHIHHKLLDIGFTHIKATIVILIFNLLIIALSLSLSHLGNIKLLLIIFPLSIILTSIPSTVLRYRGRRYFSKFGLLGDKSWIIPVTISNFSRYSIGSIKRKEDNSVIENSPTRHRDLEHGLLETFKKYNGDTDSVEPEDALYLD